jgi:hypothetical protein
MWSDPVSIYHADNPSGEEVTARVTMEDGNLKSETNELHPLLNTPELLRELRNNPKIGQHKLIIKKANHGSGVVMCHCL